MLLALGPHQFDITHRAIVMGVVDPSIDAPSDRLLRDAEHLVSEGAQALSVEARGRRANAVAAADADDADEIDRLAPAVAMLHARFDVPVSVRTTRASVARACFGEGASVGHDASGFRDPDYLPAALAAGATVVAGRGGHADDPGDVGARRAFLAERARTAAAAGLPTDRISVEADLGPDLSDASATDLLRNVDCIARLGWPVVLSGPMRDTDTDTDPAPEPAHAVGVLRGARVLRTRNVRSARRVAEVAARLLEARAERQMLEVS